MSTSLRNQIITFSKDAFRIAVSSVQPHNLLKNIITCQGKRTLKIYDKIYQFQNIYVVGFGKAVAGMIEPLENALASEGGGTIKEGVVSVPYNFQESLKDKPWFKFPTNPSIQLLEGGRNNLPDGDALRNAKAILKLVDKIQQTDLLIVLISGGGSALFPVPEYPLSLCEKAEIIRSLSTSGASIAEINIVRKIISATKGGKLASRTKAPIVSLILSDIIGDHIDLIASGPTVINQHGPADVEETLMRYNIETKPNLRAVLDNHDHSKYPKEFKHVDNYLIGSNKKALQAVWKNMMEQEVVPCHCVILTSVLKGEASTVGMDLSKLGWCILKALQMRKRKEDSEIVKILEKMGISKAKTDELIKIIMESKHRSICLILGGETTVHVRGEGVGGRNQEMVLAASLQLEQLLKEGALKGIIVLLSGGTDGIDGPTDAAGAITFYDSESDRKLQTEEARSEGLDPLAYLQNNDSYTYFNQLSNGRDILKPGHTGTNVMDIQILWINSLDRPQHLQQDRN